MHNNSDRSNRPALRVENNPRARRFCAVVVACVACWFTTANVFAAASSLPASAVVYMRSSNGDPWGLSDYEVALTNVFGPGWQTSYYETASPAALFSSTNKFIFMAGGEDSGPPMSLFLTNNLPAVSNWVASGGSLFVDLAPLFNAGTTNFVYLGFGVTGAVGTTANQARVASPSHDIFNGPFLPVGGTFTGGYFSHSTFSGVGLTTLLTNTANGGVILAERNYGPGHLIFGGMTSPSYGSPQPQVDNLLYNILTYGATWGTIQPSTRVAIYGAPDAATWNNDISNKVMSTSLFSRVDGYNVISGQPTPTLAQLQQYGAVMVYSDGGFTDPTGFGNVLADYADGGGGIVLATFDFGSGVNLEGRLSTGGYPPFTIGSVVSSVTYSLAPDQPLHPILSGATNFNGGTSSYHNGPITTTAGASLIAHWTDGQPLVATKQLTAGRMVGLNFYPPSSDARADFWPAATTDGARLLANALFWAACGSTTNVSTTSSWDGHYGIGSFGEPDTATYGQTFVAPVNTPTLTSFTLSLTNITGLVTFRFYVMAWDGAKATGPILFQSPVTTAIATNGWQPITFNTGQLALTPGSNYVAFISTSTVQDGGNKLANVAAILSDVYANGYFVYLNSGTNFTSLTNTAWNTITSFNLSFAATFSGGRLGIPPAIITQPGDQIAPFGGTATFSVTASGSPTLGYTWLHDGKIVFDNTQTSGSHTSTLTISNVNLLDGGNYSVIVSNGAGSTNSQPALLTVLPLPTVGISALGQTDEYHAIYTTLTNLGFNVLSVTNGQWAGINVIVSYPGCEPGFGPSLTLISNGFSFVKIGDWGANWTPNSFLTLAKGTNLTITVGTPHPITAGLPASWSAQGYWRYGFALNDYLGFGTDPTLPSLASETTVTNQSHVLVANTYDRGRAVYIGWNVYGPDAGLPDIAVLRNSIIWAGQASPPMLFITDLLSVSDGSLNFTWSSVPGYSYQVQYKTNLDQAAWLNLGSAITAVSNSITSSDVLGNSNRVYRVKLLP